MAPENGARIITSEQRAQVARDAQVVRDHIPRGYLVTHRTANAVDLLLDALDAAEKERDEMHALLEAARKGRDAELARANDNAVKLHATRQRAELAEAKVARMQEWIDDQMQMLPEHRTPAAHGKAELLRDLRAALADTPTIPDPAGWQDVQHARHLDAAERNGGDE